VPVELRCVRSMQQVAAVFQSTHNRGELLVIVPTSLSQVDATGHAFAVGLEPPAKV
jgi:hypothetical protein